MDSSATSISVYNGANSMGHGGCHILGMHPFQNSEAAQVVPEDHRCSGFFVIFFNMLHIDSLNIICYHYTIIPYLLILSILIDVDCITNNLT